MNATTSERVTDRMNYFLGIHVHKKNWVVASRALGMFLQMFATIPSPSARSGNERIIVKYLQDLEKDRKRHFKNLTVEVGILFAKTARSFQKTWGFCSRT